MRLKTSERLLLLQGECNNLIKYKVCIAEQPSAGLSQECSAWQLLQIANLLQLYHVSQILVLLR